MDVFVIGMIIGICISTIVYGGYSVISKPTPIGSLLVDSTDEGHTCLYLQLEDETPENVVDYKAVSMVVKKVDYFGKVDS